MTPIDQAKVEQFFGQAAISGLLVHIGDQLGLYRATAGAGRVTPEALAGQRRMTEVLTETGFSRVRRAAETPFNLILEARP